MKLNKKITKHLNKIVFALIIFLAIFLRTYKVDTLLPPYWEEVALGYDAYSISQTARDHHGNFMPLVSFESFGDWKPSFYFYTIVPFIKIIELNVLAVRLPSILAGLGIVIGIYLLLKQILPKTLIKNKPYLPLLGMFVVAISPWAVMFSRAGWEVNLATSLILWGVICFIEFIKNNKINKLKYLYLVSSILCLSLSMYTYHATRMIAPLLGVALVWLWFIQADKSKRVNLSLRKFFINNFSTILIAVFITLILTSPIILNLNNKETSQRFAETSIFSNLEIIQESNQAKLNQPNIIGKVFYHRYLLFGREILKNYLDHFTIDFLFLSGDQNPRHSIGYFGQLYHVELIYLLLGLFFVLSALRKIENDYYKNEFKNYLWFLIIWLLISIIPASLTKTTPHSLRILPSLPVFIIIITLGIGQFIEEISNLFSKLNLKHKYLISIILSLIFLFYLLELAIFWRFYTLIYPVKYSSEWQSGYEEMINSISKDFRTSKTIYITREQGRPAMYTWFYTKTNPQLVQKWDEIAKQDQGEYLEFQNIKFVNSLDEVSSSPAIVVGSVKQMEGLINKVNQKGINKVEVKKEIKNKENKVIWQIGEIK